MKIVKSAKKVVNVGRKYINIYVDESKTNYYCTAHIIGWALPVSSEWKYTKKECKTMDEAITAHVRELLQRNML